jgi:hypothetical protein
MEMMDSRAKTNLFTSFGVQKNPSQLDNLGRVSGHVDAVLIAGGSDVDDDVAVQLRRGSLKSHG